MKVFYTHQSRNDLIRLRDFIAQENPTAAAEIAKKLQQAIHQLTHFPHLGKAVKGHHNKTSMRDLVTGKYVIRYLALHNEIHILRIWHGKEDR